MVLGLFTFIIINKEMQSNKMFLDCTFSSVINRQTCTHKALKRVIMKLHQQMTDNINQAKKWPQTIN